MHRQINCTYRFKKQLIIETFFAYRLPNEKQINFVKGKTLVLKKIEEAGDNGFVFHSFSGDKIFCIQQTEIISENEFFSFQLNEEDEIVWTKEEYLQAFNKVKQELNSESIQKMILSRIKAVQSQKNALDIFREINKKYATSFNYILSNSEIGTWLGASPELLLSSDSNHLKTVSVAGTKLNDGFSEWTEKEKKEQRYVTDFILESFKKNNCTSIQSTEPFTYNAGPVQHLRSDISGLCDAYNQVWPLLSDLHPTPATCGIPKDIAKEKILQIESHKRKLYTGFIGILNGDKKTFFVNLRCMELQKNRALLYLGGGITIDSVGESEWEETERKALTLLSVLS